DVPALGDIDLSGTFGTAGLDRPGAPPDAPAEPDASPFDPVPLDLSGVDFGGGSDADAPEQATPEEATGELLGEPLGEAPGEPRLADSGYDASGWGEWPGGEPEPAEEAGAESLAA